MGYKDDYAILGVPRGADRGTFKRAFCGLARLPAEIAVELPVPLSQEERRR